MKLWLWNNFFWRSHSASELKVTSSNFILQQSCSNSCFPAKLNSSTFLPFLHVSAPILLVGTGALERDFHGAFLLYVLHFPVTSQASDSLWGPWTPGDRFHHLILEQQQTRQSVRRYVTMMVVTTTVRFSITELSLDRAFSFWTRTSLSMSFQ